MLDKGLLPTITLIGEYEGNGNKEEIAWIKYFRDGGVDLTNGTIGGEGGRRIGEAKKHHLESFQRPEVRAKMSMAARKRKPTSIETRKKQSDANTGLKRSPETVARMRIAQKRAANTPEGRAMRSAQNTGKVRPPELRERIRKTLTGRKDSPETLKRKSIAQTKSNSRPEVRKKISISLSAYHKLNKKVGV
jgi:hypothetical protein